MLQFLTDTWDYYTLWFFLFGILLSGVLAYAGFHLWKWFHILRTPTTPIANLKKGAVEIKGHVPRRQVKNTISPQSSRSSQRIYANDSLNAINPP